MTRSRHAKHPHHRWTKAECAYLVKHYPHRRTTEIARELGLRIAIVYGRANRMGLHKSAAFFATSQSGRILTGGKLSVATQFKKGQLPANAGLRRPGWHAGRMRESWFKAGERRGRANHLYRPIGTYRIADGYLQVKVNDDLPAQRRWIGVHRLVWQAAHGPVPPGHVVAFRAGLHTTKLAQITLERLELITRAELARRNRMWTRYPKPLASTMHLLGQVKRRLKQRETPDDAHDR